MSSCMTIITKGKEKHHSRKALQSSLQGMRRISHSRNSVQMKKRLRMDLLEDREELRLVEKDLRKFCCMDNNSYSSRSNFLRAFRNFLDKQVHKDPLSDLSNDKLIDMIHSQASTIVINVSSWQRIRVRLQRDAELATNFIWKIISTMEVENVFSSVRSKIPSPNAKEFKQIIKKATEESAKSYQGSKIGYIPPQQSPKSFHYYRRETLDDFPNIKKPTLPPLQKKFHKKTARTSRIVRITEPAMFDQLKNFNNRLNFKERTLRNTVAKKESNVSALMPP